MNMRPAGADSPGEFKTVVRARHLDVCKKEMHVLARFQQFERRRRVARFHHVDTRIAKKVGDKQTLQRLVFQSVIGEDWHQRMGSVTWYANVTHG